MPKVPKNDKKKKFNPLENEDDNDSEEFDVNDQDEEIPLIQKLNNGSKEERIFACHMFAKLFQDEDDDEKLNKHFESGAIKILIAAMSDTQSVVRISATGALRNFSSNCDSKGIKRLIEEDIFLPITTYFQRLKIDVKINNEEIRTQLFDHLTQLVALLSNICESSEESILRIIENGLLETIVKYLHPTLLLPDSLLTEVGELLQTISDCNEKVVVYLQKNQPLFQILNDNLKLENQNQYLKSLIIGTLFNIYETNTQQKYMFFQMCFPFFQKVLSVESLPSLLKMKEYLVFLCQVNSVEVHEKGDNKDDKDDKEDIEKDIEKESDQNEITNNNNNNTNNNEGNMVIESSSKSKLTENEIKEQEYTKKLDEWKSFTDAQRNVLEIITNFLSIDEVSENENSINLPNNILNLIYTPNFLSDILKKCGNPTELIEFESILETDQDLVRYTDCLFVVQQRALSLYNNILLFIPIKDNKTVQYIWDFYLNVIDQSIKNENLSSPEQLSLTISGLSSILRSYQNINLKQEHLLLIFKVLEVNYDYTDVVVSSLSLLGFFGQIKSFNNHLKQIADILLNFLKNESIPIILESLNSIFDVFAEESKVFKQTNMFNALAQSLKVLQNKKQNLKSEMNQNDLDEDDDEEIILEDIEEAITNLQNFLQYKKN